MADTLTTRYGLIKSEVGASQDTWGGKTNGDWDDVDALLGTVTTGGSSNAYTLTTGLALSALVNGQSFLVRWNHTNTGAATINVDGLGAVALQKPSGAALVTGDATINTYARIAYNGTAFQIVDVAALSELARLAVDNTFTQTQALNGAIGWTITSATPSFRLIETDAPVEETTWGVNLGAGNFLISTFTDAGALTGVAVNIMRTGTTVDEIELNATLLDFNGALDLSGNALVGGVLDLGGNTSSTITNSGAGRISVEGIEVTLNTATQTLTNKTLTAPILTDQGPTNVNEIGFRGAPVNTQNAAYQLVLADAGKTIYHDETTARTWTIPANASVAFPIGTVIIIDNTGNGGGAPGAITLAITTDTLRRGDGVAGTGSRTIPASAVAAIRKTKTTEWTITGTFT